MSQMYGSSNEVLTQKKSKVNETSNGELAENFLQKKGYERQVKPREINGGRDRVPQNHTVNNKARLNTAPPTAEVEEYLPPI